MRIGERIESTRDLRQGDVIDLQSLPGVADGAPIARDAPLGVVIVSQTCDIVQEAASKMNLVVAPLIEATSEQFSSSRRGRAPTLLHLKGVEGSGEAVADLQFASSVPKTEIIGRTLIARHTGHESGDAARELAHRVGRAYTRFAFPDEVVAVLQKFRDRARDRANTPSPFGRVIDYVADLRVSADQWGSPGRRMKLYVVVSTELLISPEDADPHWEWSTAEIPGARSGEDIKNANLARISELLAQACEAHKSSPSESNMTTLLRLWEAWTDAAGRELLDPQLNDEVVGIDVSLISDEEFTLRQWRRTESLDLEVLSDSSAA